MVKGLEPALVGPGVLGGVETDLGGSVGRRLGQEWDAVEVGVPGGGTDSDGGGTGSGDTVAGNLGTRKARVEAGALQKETTRSAQVHCRAAGPSKQPIARVGMRFNRIRTLAKAWTGDARAEARETSRGKAEESIGRESGGGEDEREEEEGSDTERRIGGNDDHLVRPRLQPSRTQGGLGRARWPPGRDGGFTAQDTRASQPGCRSSTQARNYKRLRGRSPGVWHKV